MKKKLLILVAALCVLAFSSSQTYEQQSLIPTLENKLAAKPFEEQLSQIKIPYYGEIISVETRGYFGFIEFLIRKTTHFISFGLIAVILYWLLPKWELKGGIVIGLVFLIAAFDEIRQGFTPGRNMSFQDVLLDTAGAAFFVGIVYFIRRIKQHKKKKNESYVTL